MSEDFEQTASKDSFETMFSSEKNTTVTQVGEFSIDKLVECGVHFGHKHSKCHPQMVKNSYIYGQVQGYDVINLDKTKENLQKAGQFLSNLISKGSDIIWICTDPAMSIIFNDMKNFTVGFFAAEWVPGTLTNFENTLQVLKNLEISDNSKQLMKTKRERSKFEKRLSKHQRIYGGFKGMTSLPGAIILCDIKKNAIAVEEAKKLGIKIIAIVDSNDDPRQVDYAIPGNNNSMRSVKEIFNILSLYVNVGLKHKFTSDRRKFNFSEKYNKGDFVKDSKNFHSNNNNFGRNMSNSNSGNSNSSNLNNKIENQPGHFSAKDDLRRKFFSNHKSKPKI